MNFIILFSSKTQTRQYKVSSIFMTIFWRGCVIHSIFCFGSLSTAFPVQSFVFVVNLEESAVLKKTFSVHPEPKNRGLYEIYSFPCLFDIFVFIKLFDLISWVLFFCVVLILLLNKLKREIKKLNKTLASWYTYIFIDWKPCISFWHLTAHSFKMNTNSKQNFTKFLSAE